jgi:hypothetical protein
MIFALACFVSASIVGVWIALDRNARKEQHERRMG